MNRPIVLALLFAGLVATAMAWGPKGAGIYAALQIAIFWRLTRGEV